MAAQEPKPRPGKKLTPSGVDEWATNLQFAEFMSDVVARFDPQLRHLYVNAAVLQHTGRAPESFLGKTNRELGMPAHLVDYWDAQLGEVFRTGRPGEAQFAMDGPAGIRNFKTQITPEIDSHGRVRSVLTFARDVTSSQILQQLTAAQSLAATGLGREQAPGYYQSIVECSDDAIIGKELNGVVTSWNQGAQAIFGYSASEMLGRSLLVLFPKDRLNEELFIIERIVHGEKVDHFDTVRLHRDGHPVHVSVTISPIRGADGRIIGASKVARDITQQRLQETRLHMALDATRTGLWDWDVRLNRVEHSTHIHQVSEIHPPGATDSLADFLATAHPDDRPLLATTLQDHRLLHTDRIELEYRLVQPPHTPPRWVWLKGQAVTRDANGRPLRVMGTYTDISKLKAHEAELDRAAHYDPLTGAPNRRLLADRMEQAIARTTRSASSLAVCYLDLDGFKAINDQFGHDMGDQLLVRVAENLKAVLRSADTLARLGGDEFVLLLADMGSPQECALILERVLKNVALPLVVNGHTLSVSASIGVSLYPQDHADADTLLRHADQAMYRAKDSGKNKFHLFDPDSDRQAQIHRQGVDRLALALSNQEFRLFYQPKVDLRTGAIEGVEALIRWQHPERGLLAPGEFLSDLEGSRVECPVGEWVLETALEQAETWRTQGQRVPISVNISANYLLAPQFVQHLHAALVRHPHVAPGDLELEVLESSAIHDLTRAVQVLAQCKALGVVLSLDDFGTGYSSLSHLRKLPVDVLKIDQSFVRGMLTDREDYSIVEGVVRLAAAFGRRVIAEGVETLAQGAALLALDCPLTQGYAIARPMPAQDLLPWMAAWKLAFVDHQKSLIALSPSGDTSVKPLRI